MRTTTGLLAALLVGGACIFGAPPLAGSFASAASGAMPGPETDPGTADSGVVTIVFHDGRTVTGKLLEETSTNVKVLVEQFGMSAEATYDKSEILQIDRDVKVEGTDADSEGDAGEDEPLDTADQRSADPGAAKVYYMELTGGLGRELAVSPLRDIVEDVKAAQPDYLIIKIDMDFKIHNDEVKDYGNFFDQFHTMRGMVPILTDDIARDRTWKKKPKLVFWVRKAMGGVAFLPFVSDTIYYTSDARQGGIGGLDHIFDGVGDEVVRQKQRSLRLARAEGMANRGGYDPRIIKAMTWESYTLSYSLVGGKPEFYENNEGDHLLTDDGQEERADAMEDIVRGRGNDILQLNAELASRLGISDGTADSLEDVLAGLGIARNYVKVESRAKRILEDWSDGVDKGERDFRRLLRNFSSTPVQGDYQERTAARGQQMRLLRQMKSILDRFGEAIDPREIRDLPDNWDMNIEIMIQRIRNEQQADGPP